jgi:hypothetical protein
MQFRVPQFIDIEDKVFGPLTLKQFGYIVGAGGISFLIWTFVPHLIAPIFIVPVVALFLSLAFVKYNNRSFGEILESAFTYYTGAKIYTWKQPELKKEETHVDQIVAETQKDIIIAKTNSNKIHELALGLDVYENNREDNPQEDNQKQ